MPGILTEEEVLVLRKAHKQVRDKRLADKIKLKREIDREDQIDKHPAGRIYLIWDNARYYYSKQVQQYLRGHPRLIPKFLPSYSPNLNLIERLWRLFHQKVTYNQYYETFPKFKESVLNFFENIHLYQKEMRTLLTDSFQLIPT